MARIVIVQFDQRVAITVAQLLRGRRHQVTVCESGGGHAPVLGSCDTCPDLIVLDVSTDGPSTRKLLEEINRFRAQNGPKPMLLCVSSVYRGPRFEFELERKGGRLVYVR